MADDDRSEPPNFLRQIMESFLGRDAVSALAKVDPERLLRNHEQLQQIMSGGRPLGNIRERTGGAPKLDAPMTREDALWTICGRPDYAAMPWKERQAEVTRLCQVPRDAYGFSIKQLRRLLSK
jgi:hypothetical protein